MKKILFLLLVTISSYAQTYQNPTYGTVKSMTAPTVSTTPTLGTIEANGTISKIVPNNVPITYTPINYAPSSTSIADQLAGIDTRLGQIGNVTAGVTTRVHLTGDNITVTAGTFFASNTTGKGATAAGTPQQTLSNNDDQKQYFTKDVISVAVPALTTAPPGVYSGQLTVTSDPTPGTSKQRFTIEIYKCNNGGTPIASGITGAPVGNLGVTVVAILDSGLINVVASALTNVGLQGNLASTLTLNTGERLRYHVSAEKVGTDGGAVTMNVYYGTNYNSYYDIPVTFNTDGVLNKSTVSGITTTDALNNLKTSITEREKLIYTTNFTTVADLSVSGAFTIVGTGLKSPASGTFGTTYAAYPKRTDLDKDVTRTIVTVNNASSIFGIIRRPFVTGIVGGTKASINGSTNTIAIYKGWDGTNTNPGVSVSATIPFSLVVGKQYLLELRKISSGLKTFSITDISSQQTFSITSNNEVDFSGNGWDYPGVSFESGDVTFNQLNFASEYPQNGLVMFSGDSFVEGSSVYNLGLGSYNKRWDKLAYDAVQGNAIISGKGGDNALDLLNRNDIDFFKSKYHVFLIGANDNTYATWKTSYDAFIAKILANGQIPVLVTIAPRADRQAFINTANAYIKTLGYRVINFAKAISLNNDEVTLDPAFYLPDNVHPNLAGHAKLYNQLRIDFPLLFDKDYNLYNANNYGSFVTTSDNVDGIIIKDGINNQVGWSRMNNGRFNIFSFDNNTSGYLPIVLACNAANPAPPPVPTGRVLVGTIVDDGVNQLQINGSTFSKGITSTNSTYRGQINSNRPVSVTSGVVAIGSYLFSGGNATSIDSNVLYSTIEGFGISGTAGSETGGMTFNYKKLGVMTEGFRLHGSGGLSLGNSTDPGATNLSVTGNITAANLTSGTYTPVASTPVNVTSSTMNISTYTRVGNIVTVNVGMLVTATTGPTNSTLLITLPIARVPTTVDRVGSGTLYATGTPNTMLPVAVEMNGTSNVLIRFTSPPSGILNTQGSITFQYFLN